MGIRVETFPKLMTGYDLCDPSRRLSPEKWGMGICCSRTRTQGLVHAGPMLCRCATILATSPCPQDVLSRLCKLTRQYNNSHIWLPHAATVRTRRAQSIAVFSSMGPDVASDWQFSPGYRLLPTATVLRCAPGLCVLSKAIQI